MSSSIFSLLCHRTAQMAMISYGLRSRHSIAVAKLCGSKPWNAYVYTSVRRNTFKITSMLKWTWGRFNIHYDTFFRKISLKLEVTRLWIKMIVRNWNINSITAEQLWQHDLWLASICDCGTICDHIMLQFVTRHDLWPKVLQFVTSVIQWF